MDSPLRSINGLLTQWRELLSMSKHILNVFRKFVLSTAFKALPLRSARLVTPEPVKSPLHPESDAWLFEMPRSVSAYMSDYTGEMARLAGALGGLHSVVSRITAEAPMAVWAEGAPAFGTVWSDDYLFDGEPLAQTGPEFATAKEHADFLFEDVTPDLERHVSFRETAQAA